ncbi:MAG: TRAP transporter large permease subunit [Thermodesulfobacteriota bacterium]|jgi:C4-dicarboxylate transporter, DctM subunit
MGGLKKVNLFDKLCNGFGLLSGILIVLNGLFCFYEVVMRYFFNSPTIWVMETTIYLVIASTFFALAYVLMEKAHVRVDSIINYLSPRTAVTLEVCTSALAILYCLVLCWQSTKMTYGAYQTWEVSPTLLKVPMFIPELFISLGSLLLTVQFIRYFGSFLTDVILSRYDDPGHHEGREAREDMHHQGFNIRQTWIPAAFLVLLASSLILLKVNVYLGLLILFLVLLFSGIPVAFALGLFGVFGFYLLFGGARMLIQVPVMAYSALDSPIVVALPLFVLTSCVLRSGQVGVRIYKFADILVRHLPGGLGIASVIFCCFFAAMTGSSVAVAATVSLIALPEMLAKGYNRKFVIGLLAAGGTLGILFPPSLPLMLYGAMTGESLGALFLGTLIPGLILSAMFCIYVAIVAGRDKNIKREPRASFKEIMTATKVAAGGLITIVIIMGGIYSGIFTPTESGGVAAVYSIILCCFIYRTLSFKGLKKAALEATRINSMIMFIVIGANITGQVVLMAQIPANLLAFVKAATAPSWVVIALINIFLIILGGPLEAITILVITLPILYPLVTGLGFSGLWFAVIMMINMELALISPPEGLNLFILQDLAKSTASEVSRSVVPYLLIIALFLILISLVPSLTEWLPAAMMK